MPKIEVDQKSLHRYAGYAPSLADLEAILPVVKGEVDGINEETGLLKLEFNDTNRPDLWSTAGAGRALRVYRGAKAPVYNFFSTKNKVLDHGSREVHVESSVQGIRPFIAAFGVSGKTIDEDSLRDIIQTQEKLCWNFGQKRKSIAMGVYRSSLVQFPVKYSGAHPDSTRFVPLGMEESLSLREILKKHPKGQEFGHIVANLPVFPYLTDAKGDTLSFPPVINSARLGAVEAGDKELFVELTGTSLPSLVLAAGLVACDLADAGFTIHPVKVIYPFDTPFGREITTPFYFQEPVTTHSNAVNKLLGENLSISEMQDALGRMGVNSTVKGEEITVTPPEYRNDFLHPVDIMEDVMVGRGLHTFEPILPRDSTVGRLTPEEIFGRRAKDLMIGLGYQEMIYTYLGSGKDYIEKMNIDGSQVVQIMNPMTENYEFVRNSILPSLLGSEAVCGHVSYPHAIFEVGKVAFLYDQDPSGTTSRNTLGFLTADKEAGFNQVNSQVSAILYYLNREYTLAEATDPRFIPGRCAVIQVKGQTVGIFGEIHPQVLENWGVSVPCAGGDLDLDLLLKATP